MLCNNYFVIFFLKIKINHIFLLQGDGAKEIDVTNVIRERDILQQERDFFKNHYNEISRRMAQAAISTPSVPQSIVSFFTLCKLS